MNKLKESELLRSLVGFLLLFLLFIGLFIFIVPSNHRSSKIADKIRFVKKEKVTYVAIGDSLTQGVGDSSKQGGFVPVLSQALESDFNWQVTSRNYGIAGNTSNQILQRIQEKKDIKRDLKKAKMMTLTVGGNDVIHVIKDNITNLNVNTFSKPAVEYQKRLRHIIELARKDNKTLPIYIVGIYNPFYLNFPEMTEMQTIVDNWNQSTEDVCKEYDNVYFVPVNALLYKGIDGKGGVTSSDETSQSAKSSQGSLNDALFEDDHFHPNNTGYQIMSDAILKRINQTKKEWSGE
ncbi:SGNH/GDSL hydrolase family protein [Streptococcus vestibularis]|jgi:lysophospholipase L1-like esterase|uniref:SGNH/GDSL hydrolase family protein n=1 Tax=Streptococcus vestibularis TaxID=1343 RepID=UPI001D0A5CCB|nr:SGNH/GDSL hydrolase family protein [Streptococcus vestibularis]MBS6380047.1 SGNH/GDSL hydrolase family protein [Streptococcus sp.]MCB8556671.1 SGNH/GDSL hydrolase family protein [Streptococcus vestibularis]MCB8587418.1 SGNH/GDSL hydrolase family protein [Streptococcus vestibularis]MDU5662798.1 SGNH/GDSL hydrolase family protein [Streptococcus vestibularis]